MEYIKRHILQDFHICSFFRLIPEHCKHLTAFTMIVSLPVSAESSAKHISVYIYRFLFTLRLRDMDNHYDAAVFFKYLYITIRQQIYRNLIFIMDRIPEVLSQFCRIVQSDHMPAAVFIFLYAKDNDSAIAVSESRIRFPQRIWKPTFGLLNFTTIVFTVRIKLGYIKTHRFHLSYSSFFSLHTRLASFSSSRICSSRLIRSSRWFSVRYAYTLLGTKWAHS